MLRPYGVYNGQSTYDLNAPWLRAQFQSPTRQLAGQTHAQPAMMDGGQAGGPVYPGAMMAASPDFYPEETALPGRRRKRQYVPTDEFFPDEQMGLKNIDPYAQRDYNLGMAERDAQLSVYGARKAQADAEAESYRNMGPDLPYPKASTPEEFLVNSGLQPLKYGRLDEATGNVIDDDSETPGAVYGMHPNPEFMDATAQIYGGRGLERPQQVRATDPAMLQAQQVNKDLGLAQQLVQDGVFDTLEEAVDAVAAQRSKLSGAQGGGAAPAPQAGGRPTPAPGSAKPKAAAKPAASTQVHMSPEDASAYEAAKAKGDKAKMREIASKYVRGR